MMDLAHIYIFSSYAPKPTPWIQYYATLMAIVHYMFIMKSKNTQQSSDNLIYYFGNMKGLSTSMSFTNERGGQGGSDIRVDVYFSLISVVLVVAVFFVEDDQQV